MKYKIPIEYLRPVPWWRRLVVKLQPVRYHKYWWPKLQWFTDWLSSLGVQRWLMVAWQPLEAADFELELDIDHKGVWHPRDPENGYLTIWYEVDDWWYDDGYDVPDDYIPAYQDQTLHHIIRKHERQILDAILQEVYG